MKKQIFGETDGIRVEVGKSPLRPGELVLLAKAARENGERRVRGRQDC